MAMAKLLNMADRWIMGQQAENLDRKGTAAGFLAGNASRTATAPVPPAGW
jgi:hypothetical protein